MAGVRRLPAGFWERLCRWVERGLEVFVIDPGPEVLTVAWFRLSAKPCDSMPGAYAVTVDHGTFEEDDAGPGGARSVFDVTEVPAVLPAYLSGRK